MRQTPEAQEQDHLQREDRPQPSTAGTPRGPASDGAAGAHRRAGLQAWGDWVRWGPIWSGFFTIVSTLAILCTLGAGITLTVWGVHPNLVFVYAWSSFVGVMAYFLGGWVTVRSAGVGGSGAALLNSGLAWALSLIVILALLVFGVFSLVGFLGNNLYLLLNVPARGVTPSEVVGTLAGIAWVAFIALVIGLALTLAGGFASARQWGGGHG